MVVTHWVPSLLQTKTAVQRWPVSINDTVVQGQQAARFCQKYTSYSFLTLISDERYGPDQAYTPQKMSLLATNRQPFLRICLSSYSWVKVA